MIANWYGRSFSLEYLRNETCISKEGVSLSGISKAAEKIRIYPYSAIIKLQLNIQISFQ
ncbi:MAG: cysteine peptidase family C39 domain-containing protein [Bacteroidales bacterium]|nr:cysteine peptidase family C39 domain-containing protein [Bacteroidales bacterium]MDD4474038.1 cysteine peptidase family C39 domain-containing protein [Bacteroidales bacterium]MDY0354152.1 cysteine peptidase family C39 domain-containing protein [Bacteroidales bacterium]